MTFKQSAYFDNLLVQVFDAYSDIQLYLAYLNLVFH